MKLKDWKKNENSLVEGAYNANRVRYNGRMITDEEYLEILKNMTVDEALIILKKLQKDDETGIQIKTALKVVIDALKKNR